VASTHEVWPLAISAKRKLGSNDTDNDPEGL
jgi:hypothetical protein